jgi:predicted peptidase
MPLWVFHGDADPLIPVEESRRAFEALSQAGGNIKYTELHGVGHDSWVQGFRYKGDDEAKAYVTRYSGARNDRTADVWEWLFAQTRGR